LAEPAAFQTLAKRFIQAGEDECLAPEDVADSVKELVNVTAGLLKTEAAKQNHPLKLGLPFFLEGNIKSDEAQEVAAADIILGGLEVRLQVLRILPQLLGLIEKPALGKVASRSPQEWLGEALTAAFLFTLSTLKPEKYQVKKIIQTFASQTVAGAYVPLIGEDDAVLLGLLSDEDGLREIARNFLELPRAEAPDAALTADAIKEIINIISGMMKTQLFKQNTPIVTNLPFFVDGYIEVTEKQDASAALIEIGNIQTYLVIIKRKMEQAGDGGATA
jgi:CheY-specific phosphatase CheX